MPTRSLSVWALLVLATGIARAGPTFVVTSEWNLYRVSGGGQETFPLADRIHSLHYDAATNQGYAVGHVADGAAPLYRVTNLSAGTPSFEQISHVSDFFGSLTMIDGQLYGFSHGDLYTIDPTDPNMATLKLVGSTGIDASGGAAYDATADVLYMFSHLTDTLYTVDYSTGAATAVGPAGIDAWQSGMDWWNGSLYLAAQNGTSGSLEIGRLDPQSGLYATELTFPDVAGNLATALAIVPEPAAFMLIGLAALTAPRRR